MGVHPNALQPRRQSAAGFTLVELMVTLVVFGVVAGAVTLILMNSAKSKQRTTQHLESLQAARAAIDLISRDIRSAGYGTDRDHATPQPAIAYVDSTELIIAENQLPFPENPTGPLSPLAYNPLSSPRPQPLDGTPYAPPTRYRTGAELIRYTLDVNDDGAINASDVSAPEGADAASTPNPSDYVLVRQVYGDSTGNVAGDNGGTTERVALVRKPGDAGVPAMFTVYMKGNPTPWDWSSGPVPPAQLQNIQRIELKVTAAASRPDARGEYPQTTLKSEVNAARSVPDFGVTTHAVQGYVFNDLNENQVMDSGEPGLPGATVRLGYYVSYTSGSGFYQIHAAPGNYVLRHTSPMGYGSLASPDTFGVTLTNAGVTRNFPDTARAGGNVLLRAFDDENGNASWDGGEAALHGIRFNIVPGTPERTTGVTDAAGELTMFTGVGGYDVTCSSPDSMIVTTPNPVSDVMTDGGSNTHLFGLSHTPTGHIQGKVFVDANRDGNLGGSEAGIANVWVGVSKDGGMSVASYGTTDAAGLYDLTVPVNDPPHVDAYSVYVVPPPGYFPTTTTSIGGLWLQTTPALTGRNFGMANFQIITLNASRVLSLTAADVIEKDWNGNHTENAREDQDLILGADAGSTDNVSVWFNRYASAQLFNSTPTNPDGYSRLAPNSVLAMAADTLDSNGIKARRDLVTGTRYTAAGNFFVWFTQGSSNNEGYLPTSYSTGQNYHTTDNGDVQAVVTLDCGGGDMPDIIVGTKSATAGQGSVEVWLSDDATTPTFTHDETFNTISTSTLGEVTGMTLADLDNDGDRDLIVATRTSDYNGQVGVWANTGRTTGARFTLRNKITLTGDAPTCVSSFDGDGDGWKDIFVGTQRSTASGRVMQLRNLGATSLFVWSNVRNITLSAIVMSLNAADFGGSASRTDLAVGYRSSSVGYSGGVTIYFMDLGLLPSSGVDPSAGSVINMVPALTSANFNYGLNTTTPPSPYLTDLAAGVKASATTGALVVFVR